MTQTDLLLKNNEAAARTFTKGNLPLPPSKKLAVLACMDARLDVHKILGLSEGDAHIIRNAGGVATDDAIRSLLISQRLLGTEEIVLIHHTDCGMLTFKDADLFGRLERETGVFCVSPEQFHSFSKLEENVRRQIQKVHAHPWVPKSITVRGFVFDVKTGRLNEVTQERAAGASD